MPQKILEGMLKKNISDRDIFHDLMPYRVSEILLVSTFYDSYIIQREGGISELIFGEYSQLNISSAPRITSVTTEEKALKKLKRKKFDMIIIMMGVEKNSAFIMSKEIKKRYPKLPLLLLLNNNSDIKYLKERNDFLEYIDHTFVWNGDSRIFLAMIKIIEDRKNVKKDTKKGDVRVILLVENSIKYYSRYLPILYTVVMKQTQRMIKEEHDEFYKLLRMRGRAKVLLAKTYEEAIEYYHKYKDYLLCLISDVEFDKDGVQNKEAGLDLIKYVQNQSPTLPTLLQSSNIFNSPKAFELNSRFIYKHSESLLQELKNFFMDSLGFGDFVFKNKKGEPIASAHTIKEFIELFCTIPEETIIYHALRNHFSAWLIARGKIKIAKKIKPQRVSQFKTIKSLKSSIIKPLKKDLFDKIKGEVVDFSDSDIKSNSYITKVSKGSLGGKGRGLAFANHLLNNIKLSKVLKDIKVEIPRTMIIGTEAFDEFIEKNKILNETIFHEKDFKRIKGTFLNAKLPNKIIKKLKHYLKKIDGPIAVRSSGLFEDSLLHPFAGVYHTYLLPNNGESFENKMQYLIEAIKLVYASIFTVEARSYFEAVGHKIEEEKMAVIIQEVVGNEYNDKFYPHISGVAQSYNYYPISHMEAEDGICVIALGLGRYVVDGENAYRFCPKYPKIEISKDEFIASQSHFYSLDLSKKKLSLFNGEDATLLSSSIEEAEKDGTLNNIASTFDVKNRRIVPGIYTKGPRIINFANILKYNYIPLAKTVETVLELFEEGLGNPVEIEFAIDLTKDRKGKATFYLLQIKPLIKGEHLLDVDFEKIDKDKLIIYSENTLGNGIIENITDIIYIDKDKFDKSKTLDMVLEIQKLNQKMKEENRQYVLIGPGRWGSSDRWLGIPIAWSQISNAKVIIETDLEGYAPDSSSGSHFFHNIISMGVGYFTIKHDSKTDFINCDIFNNAELLKSDGYFRHIRFEDGITVMMNGKSGVSLVLPRKDALEILSE